MLVIKFGGSSVADAARLRQVAAIVADHHRRGPVVVVVSAMAGVTDALLAIARSGMAHVPGWQTELAAIGERHHTAYRELGASVPSRFQVAWERCVAEAEALARAGGDERDQARFSGWGERLVVGLLAWALAAEGIAAEAFASEPLLLASLRESDLPPEPSLLATRGWLVPQLSGMLLRGAVPVLPGYIARDAVGRATTLGRNGSDYSATVVAAALGAQQVIISSDVAGVFTADPRVVPEAHVIPWLTYAEAAAIARLGAKVLHPRTVDPLVRWGIPLDLRSTLDPQAPGTTIAPTPGETRREPAFVVFATRIADQQMRVGVHLLGEPDALDRAEVFRSLGREPSLADPSTLAWDVPLAEAAGWQHRLHAVVMADWRSPVDIRP